MDRISKIIEAYSSLLVMKKPRPREVKQLAEGIKNAHSQGILQEEIFLTSTDLGDGTP